VLYRRLKFSGEARVKFHTSIKFHFRSQAEVKRKTPPQALLDALRKIAVLVQRSFAARMFAAALKFIIPHRRRPNKILNPDLHKSFYLLQCPSVKFCLLKF